MTEHFLRYSLRWACPVKLVYLLDGQMKSGNATVIALHEDSVDVLTARNKKTPLNLPFEHILAAGYARGDDGDTAKRAKTQNAQEKNETETE